MIYILHRSSLVNISLVITSNMLFLQPVDCTQSDNQSDALSYCFYASEQQNQAVQNSRKKSTQKSVFIRREETSSFIDVPIKTEF